MSKHNLLNSVQKFRRVNTFLFWVNIQSNSRSHSASVHKSSSVLVVLHFRGLLTKAKRHTT